MDSSSTLPDRGYIDLHSHILPAVDDGCVTLAESLDCVRGLKANGYVGSVCTPHFGREISRTTTPVDIARRVESLRDALADAQIDYQLWAGAEVRISKSTVAWFEEVGVPTLGDSRVVLIDYWGVFWPPAAEQICRYLIDGGYRVLLAHPERMELAGDALSAALTDLDRWGVELQGNLNSIAGGEGPLAAQWAERLLNDDRYFVLASDLHSPWGLPRRMSAIASLAQQKGQAAVDSMLDERPRALLADRLPTASP